MRAVPWWSVDLSNTFYHGKAALTMTTNEIAAAVQAGQADRLELWEAVRRFAHDRAYRWCRAMDGRAGMVLEDYIQVAFLALLDALEGWDPAAGAFLTWYSLKLKGAFTEAVGMRTQRDKRDPIHHALSLDAPFMDSESGESLTFADILEDPAASEEIAGIAERDFQDRRRMAVRRAVDSLQEQQRQAVVLRYCYGLSLDQTAARMSTSRAAVRVAEHKGLRLLRHPMNSRELRIYY